MNDPRVEVRLGSDYSAGWPVWGEAAEAAILSPELTRDLVAWDQLFDDFYHWQTGWKSGAAEAQYAREAPDLRDRLAHELGPNVHVTADLWPVTNDSLVEWLDQRFARQSDW